ncbi:MAG: 4-hydroxy-tetrahydrodipicolinate reductase [Candidatus Geothermincolia bacterium]
MIRVGVTGACGRMGREVCRAVLAQDDMCLVAAVDPVCAGDSLAGLTALDTDLTLAVAADELVASRAQVLVDFTVADAAFSNIVFALEHGIHAVVGTTGFTLEMLGRMEAAGAAGGANLLIAPNFALGAVLMMAFARQAARYFTNCEIIELHHDRKLDAPSGTALHTANLVGGEWPGGAGASDAGQASRGLSRDGINIHSVRLPGLVAHQEIIFGGEGQTLTIRHDSLDRSSFMPGVLYAVRQVPSHPGMTVGLEEWLST